ncbi:hypothetical protein V2H45_18200 [Tumidithrix elongata RA019]|uniref:Uncharacterized protein n=1 Tax=Tumidithrix elongata BACA0141 TaxID=2716417 RepID=A0AAW9PW49_9CYAN|nr:hypothetical protein [Tumidithrix elongata RA019]
MSNPNDIEERFRQLEREMNMKSSEPPLKRAEPEKSSQNSSPFGVDGINMDTAKSGLGSLISWINSLTGATKVIAIAVVGIITFTILNILFKAVMAAISLGIMALVVFVLYKVFFQPSSSTESKP